MRICLTGFYGYGNIGDEGILLAVIDSLGLEHEYVVCTSLPFDRAEEYRQRLPYCVDEVIQIDDIRGDYDILLLGGGGLTWGYGWRQVLVALSHDKPVMNYGVGYSRKPLYNPKLRELYRCVLSKFKAITVRDEYSQQLLNEIGVESIVTGCPSINLEPKSTGYRDAVVACPRFEDYQSNNKQIAWFTQKLKELAEPIILVPFAPKDQWGSPVDLTLCNEIAERVHNSEVYEINPFKPRELKYKISEAKRVVSGGRLHALIWAAAHNVPYEVCPTALREEKIKAFLHMHSKYGDKLKAMERRNAEVFNEIA